jgi:hypothetical protein
VSRVLRRKKAAIACHRSQITDLIDDDPTGFRLSPGTIAHFCTRWEIFYEARTGREAQTGLEAQTAPPAGVP